MPAYRDEPRPCPLCGLERTWYFRPATPSRPTGRRQAHCPTCRRRTIRPASEAPDCAQPPPDGSLDARIAHYQMQALAELPLDYDPWRADDDD